MAAVPSIGRATLVEAPRVAPQAAATEGLYERHAAKIQSYCHHQLGSREEAEDAVQTTFMNAFRALGRGVVPEAESAWLFKIAENVCLSRRRSSWRRGKIESPSDFGVIEEIVPGPSLQRDELIGIEDALASMPEQQRRAILLREWQGLSYREIAAELEVSQSAVETLIFRARRSLAQGLEQPDSVKPKRKSFRRALHVVDFGTIVAALKTVLIGGAAVKATVAAVAVTAAVGTAATVTPELKLKGRAKAPAVALVAPAPARSSSSSLAVAASAAAVDSASKPLATPASRPAKQKPTRSAPVSSPVPPCAAGRVRACAGRSGRGAAERRACACARRRAAEAREDAAGGRARQARGRGQEARGQAQGQGHGGAGCTRAGACRRRACCRAGRFGAGREAGRQLEGPQRRQGEGSAVVVQAPAPAAVTAAAPAPAEAAKDQSSKKERGRGNVKRELTSVPVVPMPAPVVASAEPTPAPRLLPPKPSSQQRPSPLRPPSRTASASASSLEHREPAGVAIVVAPATLYRLYLGRDFR